VDRHRRGPQLLDLGKRIARWRFFRFGVVGASGIVVNLSMLFLAQEWLFAAVESSVARLNMSLALAIFVATINNFTWNRAWTWHDRKMHVTTPIVLQYGQYALSSWLGILLQVTLTNLFAARVHYLIANAMAIAIASLFNFVANDMWTFGRLKMWLRRRS
jgi:putative flippase GtrA